MSVTTSVLATFVVACLHSAPQSAPRADDPALLRLQLLREMDARIDEGAARAHIEARLLIAKIVPIAFLGMVAEPVEPNSARIEVTQIYRESGADRAGLHIGDTLLALAGTRIESKAVLYREIRLHRPGETVDLRIRRAGQELVLRPTFGIRWQEDEEDEEQYGDIVPAKFASSGLPVELTFDRDALDATPGSLEPVLGGLGAAPRYVVARDGVATVLRQEAADNTGIRFPMALVRGVDANDVVGRLRFRLVGGAQDRAAGIVLRYAGPHDYLIARVNAVEGDLRVFRSVNGLRRTLPGAVAPIQIDDERWHTLEFRVEGPKVTAVLDDTTTVTSYDTYFAHGRVGLWTKSDSVTEFDDVTFRTPDGH